MDVMSEGMAMVHRLGAQLGRAAARRESVVAEALDSPLTIARDARDIMIAGSPDRRIAGSPDRRIAGSPILRPRDGHERVRTTPPAGPSVLPA